MKDANKNHDFYSINFRLYLYERGPNNKHK